jgi:hypothetical protein
MMSEGGSVARRVAWWVPAVNALPGRRLTHLAAPSLRVIHPVDARAPEECVLAMPHSMVYHVRARIPGYRDWYADRDATPDYDCAPPSHRKRAGRRSAGPGGRRAACITTASTATA